ncbi:MAG: nitrilase [Trebouxia sp. A1-2]|nr:MAG: nitrilase [Trebouxia sp. A1-2]
MKIAAAHVSPVFMDALSTANKAVAWIERAKNQDVDLLVFPETFIPGFPIFINCYPPPLQHGLLRTYQDQSVELEGAELSMVQAAVQRCGVAVVLGISERCKGGRTCYNATVAYDKDGTFLGVHRKLLPTYAERYVWGRGDGSGLLAWDSSVGRIGSLICWEHTMNLAREAMAEQRVQIHTAHWPALSSFGGFETVANPQVQAMMLNHALTAQCFVVCASSPTSQESIDHMEKAMGPQSMVKPGGGWTAIVHPFTPILAGPATDGEEQLVTAEVNLDEIKDAKEAMNALCRLGGLP